MLTLAAVLALPVVRAGEPEILVAEGLDQPVRWVHSSDLADLTDLLQGGELVLTTGRALRRSPSRYLQRLATTGAVGVLVELDPAAGPLPPTAEEVASRLGLTLVVLHRRTRFVEITEEVHRLIVSAQYGEVVFARRVHEEFTHLTMRRAVPAEIVETAVRLLDCPVVLEDLLHQAVAAASPSPDTTADLLHNWQRRSRLQDTSVGPGNDEPSWSVHPVGRGEEQWASLVALTPPDVPPERLTMVLERAAQALVMHRMAERGKIDLVRQAQAGLIEDVVRGRVRTEKEALARAAALGLDVGGLYVPAAVRVGPATPSGHPLQAQKQQAELLDIVARTTHSQGCTALLSLGSNGVVSMVLTTPPRHERDLTTTLETLARAMRRDVRHTLGLANLVLGRAPVQDGVIEAIEGIASAAHVAGAAASLPVRDQTCFQSSDLRLRGLIAQLSDDSRTQRFAESELRELITDDLATGADGISVLRGFLELAGNKTLLAQRLHISRPALYNRLGRIERILGVRLDDGESRTSLHVALLVVEARSTLRQHHQDRSGLPIWTRSSAAVSECGRYAEGAD